MYFFRRAHDRLPDGGRAGLVGTNTIRQGATRQASLDYITEHDGVIYDAVSSQPWSGDAVVEVSIVNWAKGIDPSPNTLWVADGTVKLELEHIPVPFRLKSTSPRLPNFRSTARRRCASRGRRQGIRTDSRSRSSRHEASYKTRRSMPRWFTPF